MDNIQAGLESKAVEINQLQAEIDAIIQDSDKLKPTVQQFEEKRQKANELKATLKKMKKSYNSFIEFLKTIDSHYLDVSFPLFKDHQDENTRTWIEGESSVGSPQPEINKEAVIAAIKATENPTAQS